MMFRYNPKDIEEQKKNIGVPPRDLVDPFNQPSKLRPDWHIYAVEANLWRVRLSADQVMTGANVDTSVAEGNWNFWHIIRNVYFHQYVTATGVRDDTALTWEWSRRVGGDYYPIRVGTAETYFNVGVEEIMYRTNYEDYRWRFNGDAANSVALEVWVEVLRV